MGISRFMTATKRQPRRRRSTDPYAEISILGIRIDPYRVAELFGIDSPPVQHALKKLLRFGRSHKDRPTDIREAIASLQRWQEIQQENRRLARWKPRRKGKGTKCPVT